MGPFQKDISTPRQMERAFYRPNLEWAREKRGRFGEVAQEREILG